MTQKTLQHYLDRFLLLELETDCLDRIDKTIAYTVVNEAEKINKLGLENQVKFIYENAGAGCLEALLKNVEVQAGTDELVITSDGRKPTPLTLEDIKTLSAPATPYELLRSLHPADALEIAIEYIQEQDSDDAFNNHLLERWSFEKEPVSYDYSTANEKLSVPSALHFSEDDHEVLDSIVPNTVIELALDYIAKQGGCNGFMNYVVNHLEVVSNPKQKLDLYCKTTFELTVLSNYSCKGMPLEKLTYKMSHGHFAGNMEVKHCDRLTPAEMLTELENYTFEPELFLGDDTWKYRLKVGDTAVWHPEGCDRPARRGPILHIQHCLDYCIVQWIQPEYIRVPYGELVKQGQ